MERELDFYWIEKQFELFYAENVPQQVARSSSNRESNLNRFVGGGSILLPVTDETRRFAT